MQPSITEVFWYISDYRATAVNASQKARSAISLHAFQAVEKYLNGVILQWNRIVDSTYRGRDWRELYFEMSELELQFYLVSWDMVKKYLGLFVREEHDKAIYIAYNKVKVILHDASSARNYYEHSDRELKSHGLGATGHGFSHPKSLRLTYPKLDGKKRSPKTFDLGMPEIKLLVHVFDEIVGVLNSR